MRIAVAALLLSGCTLVTDLDAYECESDLDCSEGRICSANNLCLLTSMTAECGPATPCPEGELCAAGQCEADDSVRWGCVGGISEDPITGSEAVTLRIQLRAEGGALPLFDAVEAAACADPDCDDMQGLFTPDERGVVDVVVHQGFEGFVRLTGAGFLDTFYQLQAPLNADAPHTADVTMLSASDVATIAQAAGAEVNLDERGVVLLEVRDCVGDLSEDVIVTDLTPSAATDIVYLTADMKGMPAADATGIAGLAMALGAAADVSAFAFVRNAESASTIDLGSLAVKTVAGAVTYAPYQIGR